VTGLGSFTEDTLLGLVAAVAGVEYLAVRDLTVPPEIVRRLPGDVIRRHRALPVAFIAGELRGTLAVAMADPFDAATVDTLAAEARMSVKPILAAERALEAAIARHLAG
jgi:type IV pilus assembly protein PilB